MAMQVCKSSNRSDGRPRFLFDPFQSHNYGTATNGPLSNEFNTSDISNAEYILFTVAQPECDTQVGEGVDTRATRRVHDRESGDTPPRNTRPRTEGVRPPRVTRPRLVSVFANHANRDQGGRGNERRGREDVGVDAGGVSSEETNAEVGMDIGAHDIEGAGGGPRRTLSWATEIADARDLAGVGHHVVFVDGLPEGTFGTLGRVVQSLTPDELRCAYPFVIHDSMLYFCAVFGLCFATVSTSATICF